MESVILDFFAICVGFWICSDWMFVEFCRICRIIFVGCLEVFQSEFHIVVEADWEDFVFLKRNFRGIFLGRTCSEVFR